METKRFTAVTSGMSGWQAVLCDCNGVIDTGMGRYRVRELAENEAREWARTEGIEYAGN